MMSNEYSSSKYVNANTIYDEIKKDKAANGDVSPETWRITLIEKYDNLMKVIHENLPQLRLQIELQLSVKSILNIKDLYITSSSYSAGSTKFVEDSRH